MPTYDVYVWTKFRRMKYPRSLNIPSLEAAHSVALRMARVFIGLMSSRTDLAIIGSDFVVEVVDQAGRAVLTVPGRWMGPVPSVIRNVKP
jgi:hypothetical protein